MHPTDTHLVEVYRAANPIEAHTIRLALEDAGIQVEIDGESLQGGEYPLGWSTAPRIMVAESQVTAAREVMEQAHAQRTAVITKDETDDVLRCLACGQVMELANKCSTCGWSYQDAEPIPPILTSNQMSCPVVRGQDRP